MQNLQKNLALVIACSVGVHLAGAQNPATPNATPATSLKDILGELDKPRPTPTPVIPYKCTEQGVKDALSDLIKLTYKMESFQQQLGGKQQRMINDLEKFIKNSTKDPSSMPAFESIEKEALAFADSLELNITDGEHAFSLIRPIKEICSLDTVKNNRAAADLNRRIPLLNQVFTKLKEQPVKLREALKKVREEFVD